MIKQHAEYLRNTVVDIQHSYNRLQTLAEMIVEKVGTESFSDKELMELSRIHAAEGLLNSAHRYLSDILGRK